MMRRTLACAAAAASFVLGDAACAAPEEIQVYTDEMTGPGHFGMDLHNNFVISGSSEPDYPGAQPPDHVYRFTPEFYYGVSNTVEAGLYVLATTAPDGQPNFVGQKLRLKYIAPHDETRGAFWGANLEVGKTSHRVSQAPWNSELKGIYGYRSGRWTLAGNLDLDWSLSGPVNTPVSAGIDTKVAYRTSADYDIGFESYNELGPLRHMGHLNQLDQTLYAVIDAKVGKLDLNAGLGRGLNPASDRWVFKFIVGVEY